MKSRILIDFVATAKMFFRRKDSIFWTIAFPVLLIIIFGAIFSGIGESSYNLYVQNQDSGPGSLQYLEALNSTGVVNVKMVGGEVNPDQYISDESVSNFLIIPANFSLAIIPNSTETVTLELRQDQTTGSASVVFNVVSSVTNGFNLQLSGGRDYIMVDVTSIVQKGLTFIDFFLPGVIGLIVMSSCVFNMQGVQSNYFAKGIFRKLSTTPLTRFEWLISRALFQILVVFIGLAAVLIVGFLFFDVNLTLTPLAVVMVVVGCLLFTGLGMMISRFAKDEDAAQAASNAITFPMMFLSGSFFALESMPSYLQAIAQVLPLTYLNNGLRDTMIYANDAGAWFNLGVLAIVAVIMVAIGAYISRWTED